MWSCLKISRDKNGVGMSHVHLVLPNKISNSTPFGKLFHALHMKTSIRKLHRAELHIKLTLQITVDSPYQLVSQISSINTTSSYEQMLAGWAQALVIGELGSQCYQPRLGYTNYIWAEIWQFSRVHCLVKGLCDPKQIFSPEAARFRFFFLPYYPPLKLTSCPWKWMVGRWNFLVSFREGIGRTTEPIPNSPPVFFFGLPGSGGSKSWVSWAKITWEGDA